MLSWIDADSDLDSIRNEPRFVAMMAAARERMAAKDAVPKPAAKRARKPAAESKT